MRVITSGSACVTHGWGGDGDDPGRTSRHRCPGETADPDVGDVASSSDTAGMFTNNGLQPVGTTAPGLAAIPVGTRTRRPRSRLDTEERTPDLSRRHTSSAHEIESWPGRHRINERSLSTATPSGRRPCGRRNQLRPPSRKENGLVVGVELRGLEPLTPTLPVWCATSCATAPCRPGLVCPGRVSLYSPDDAGPRRGEARQTCTPRALSHGTGLIRLPSSPPWCTSKCRCGPVDWPRLPSSAIVSPASTYWPGSTRILSMWP